MNRGKENDTKGLRGSLDGQAQGKSETYGGEQDLEAKHDTNLHYFHQYNTSLQEMIVELQKYEFSPHED